MLRSWIGCMWGHAAIIAPGATSSWTGAASSLECSRPPPAPRAHVATSALTSRTSPPFTSSPRTLDAVFKPVRGGRTANRAGGRRRQASVSRMRCEVILTMGRGEAMIEERVDPRRAQVAQVGEREEKSIRVRFSVVTNPAPSPKSALGGLVPVRPSEARAVKLIVPSRLYLTPCPWQAP